MDPIKGTQCNVLRDGRIQVTWHYDRPARPSSHPVADWNRQSPGCSAIAKEPLWWAVWWPKLVRCVDALLAQDFSGIQPLPGIEATVTIGDDIVLHFTHHVHNVQATVRLPINWWRTESKPFSENLSHFVAANIPMAGLGGYDY